MAILKKIFHHPKNVKKRHEKRHVDREEEVFESSTKYSGNPIIIPDPETSWKSWQTFNPAAVLLQDTVHLLYRAIGSDGVSRFGYARSKDGFHLDTYSSDNPAYCEKDETTGFTFNSPYSGGSFFGSEDPRLTYMEDGDMLYTLYTSCSDGLRVGLSSITRDNFLAQRWDTWSERKLISPPDEVHKNWVLFPEKIKGKYAICHSLSPLSIEYLDDLEFADGAYIQSTYRADQPSERWDLHMRGAGSPPIRTDEGWLLFYHAMNHKDKSCYRIGALLLDIQDPTVILYRSEKPVLTPTESYENEGHKSGVVYTTGAVVMDGDLLLYYGGADTVVCVAHANLQDFLEELKGSEKVADKKQHKVR